jgi:hypothetical protein
MLFAAIGMVGSCIQRVRVLEHTPTKCTAGSAIEIVDEISNVFVLEALCANGIIIAVVRFIFCIEFAHRITDSYILQVLIFQFLL